jgi:hypothetical protein
MYLNILGFSFKIFINFNQAYYIGKPKIEQGT